MPINPKDYPEDWQERRARHLKRTGNRCEGSPKYPGCRAENHKQHPVTGTKVKLALCHYDRDVNNNHDSNYRVWCQRCHLSHDKHQHVDSRKYGRKARQQPLLPFSWSKLRHGHERIGFQLPMQFCKPPTMKLIYGGISQSKQLPIQFKNESENSQETMVA